MDALPLRVHRPPLDGEGNDVSYVSSSSTDAEVIAAYEDNASYDVASDVTMCREFIAACRVYLRRMTEATQHGDASVRDTYQKIREELDAALRWWRANDSTAAGIGARGGVKVLSIEDFRK